MLSNLLENFLKAQVLKNHLKIDKEKIKKIAQFLSYYDEGGYFTNSHFSSRCFLDEKDSLKVILILVKNNYLQPIFKFKCPECGFISKEIYSIGELIESLICGECSKELLNKDDVAKFLILYFKVIKK